MSQSTKALDDISFTIKDALVRNLLMSLLAE
jgi:hypothetical protein